MTAPPLLYDGTLVRLDNHIPIGLVVVTCVCLGSPHLCARDIATEAQVEAEVHRALATCRVRCSAYGAYSVHAGARVYGAIGRLIDSMGEAEATITRAVAMRREAER